MRLLISGRARSKHSPILNGVRSQGTVEELGLIELEAGKPVDVYVEYTNTKPPAGPDSDRSQPALMRGVVSIEMRFRELKTC